MTHHQQRVETRAVEIENVRAMHLAHASFLHDPDGLGADVHRGDGQAPALKNQTVQPRARSYVQDMTRTTIDRRSLDRSELRGIAEEDADRNKDLLAVVSTNRQFGGGVAFEVGEQRHPERLHRCHAHPNRLSIDNVDFRDSSATTLKFRYRP